MSNNWIPEIMYEETDEGLSSHIPFIMVPLDQVMPKMIFVFESRETGEHEPGLDGDADMVQLKEGLDAKTYDEVRICLGLEPLIIAADKGSKITESIRKNLDNS